MRLTLSSLKNIFLVVAILIAIISFVYATPTVPTAPQQLTRLEDERYNESQHAPQSLEAEAGNVTRIYIYALTQTETWQGFYGEIEGTITLDDAQNWTMYDWNIAEPQGEIYATPTIISNWETAHCLNYSAIPNYCLNLSINTTPWNGGTNSFFTTNFTLCNLTLNVSGIGNFSHVYYYQYDYDYDNMTKTKNSTTSVYLNRSMLEFGNLTWSLGLTPDTQKAPDYDGVDETFNDSGQVTANYSGGSNRWVNHTIFWVGTVEIRQGTCPAADMYETICMNITDPRRNHQVPIFYKLNDTQTSDMIPFNNISLCEAYYGKPSAFNATYMFNVTIGNATGGTTAFYGLNLSGQVFKYMSSDYGSNFQEVLLTVNNSQTVIYTTIIENKYSRFEDIMGFDNETHDFQMIVGDDGHPGPKQDTTTTYYFYVEIE